MTCTSLKNILGNTNKDMDGLYYTCVECDWCHTHAFSEHINFWKNQACKAYSDCDHYRFMRCRTEYGLIRKHKACKPHLGVLLALTIKLLTVLLICTETAAPDKRQPVAPENLQSMRWNLRMSWHCCCPFFCCQNPLTLTLDWRPKLEIPAPFQPNIEYCNTRFRSQCSLLDLQSCKL